MEYANRSVRRMGMLGTAALGLAAALFSPYADAQKAGPVNQSRGAHGGSAPRAPRAVAPAASQPASIGTYAGPVDRTPNYGGNINDRPGRTGRGLPGNPEMINSGMEGRRAPWQGPTSPVHSSTLDFHAISNWHGSRGRFGIGLAVATNSWSFNVAIARGSFAFGPLYGLGFCGNICNIGGFYHFWYQPFGCYFPVLAGAPWTGLYNGDMRLYRMREQENEGLVRENARLTKEVGQHEENEAYQRGREDERNRQPQAQTPQTPVQQPAQQQRAPLETYPAGKPPEYKSPAEPCKPPEVFPDMTKPGPIPRKQPRTLCPQPGQSEARTQPAPAQPVPVKPESVKAGTKNETAYKNESEEAQRKLREECGEPVFRSRYGRDKLVARTQYDDVAIELYNAVSSSVCINTEGAMHPVAYDFKGGRIIVLRDKNLINKGDYRVLGTIDLSKIKEYTGKENPNGENLVVGLLEMLKGTNFIERPVIEKAIRDTELNFDISFGVTPRTQ